MGHPSDIVLDMLISFSKKHSSVICWVDPSMGLSLVGDIHEVTFAEGGEPT